VSALSGCKDYTAGTETLLCFKTHPGMNTIILVVYWFSKGMRNSKANEKSVGLSLCRCWSEHWEKPTSPFSQKREAGVRVG